MPVTAVIGNPLGRLALSEYLVPRSAALLGTWYQVLETVYALVGGVELGPINSLSRRERFLAKER